MALQLKSSREFSHYQHVLETAQSSSFELIAFGTWGEALRRFNPTSTPLCGSSPIELHKPFPLLLLPFRTFFPHPHQQTVAHNSLIKFDYLHTAQKYPRHLCLPLLQPCGTCDERSTSTPLTNVWIGFDNKQEKSSPPTLPTRSTYMPKATCFLLSLEHRESRFSTRLEKLASSWKLLSLHRSFVVFRRTKRDRAVGFQFSHKF